MTDSARPPHKAAYLIPNMFTTLSLMCGFYAVIVAFGGRYLHAAGAIMLSTVFDLLDGTAARLTRTASALGVQYDSLADLISFGMAPAILMYFWALAPESMPATDNWYKAGLVAAFIYLTCGALRLARFNASAGRRDPRFFQGLPISAGAGLISAFVLLHSRPDAASDSPSGLAAVILLIVLGALMVSSLDYPSHKNPALKGPLRKPLIIACAVLLATLLFAGFQRSLWPLGLGYLALGPLVTIYRKWKRATGRPSAYNMPEAPASSNAEEVSAGDEGAGADPAQDCQKTDSEEN